MRIARDIEFLKDELRILALGEEIKPEIRRLNELKSVLMMPESLEKDGIAYMMYRDLPPLRGSPIRLDVTVIPPWNVGGELAKTKGHYHLPLEGKSLPEIYYVHSGRAIFLLQRRGASIYEIEDFIVIEAEAGRYVMVPPGYGHVSVNAGEDMLVMSNLIHRGVMPDYEPYEITRGAAYYVTSDGLVRNPRYEKAPDPRYEKGPEYSSLEDLMNDRGILERLTDP
ncbi:glucose-6-phosphate isomerase family protein [Candidatus Korarchaeum cryptofilum]|uniref:glucose-6-phosphate isomerase n=1 Tax=Korarchaeum cryptofilum (strain OPF8) TaxID=374847 RepID=B1L5P0_KORCO|nr:glucose-6-phosphate isomerase family protein [Candidatus Korarchaeum cryptofilum]ACB07769.1 glucose-6-phosphate isomerase [Candidatus Korarchaeum cryptofilum OPF8]